MKLQKIRRLVSFVTCFSLIFQTFLPFTLALPVYADDEVATESAAPITIPENTSTVSSAIVPPVENNLDATSSSNSEPSKTQENVDNNTVTFNDVTLNTTYQYKDTKVSVTFSKLPEKPGNLTIHEISLTPEQIAEFGSLSDKAYDITSNMEDGSFEYSLTLPKPDAEKIEVKYSEDGKDFVTSGGVSTTENSVVVSNVDHFTIYVVSSPSSANTNGGSGNAWKSTSNVYENDGNKAYVDLYLNNKSEYLRATNFNLNIPSSSVIKGITVEIEKRNTDHVFYIQDNSVKLIKGGVIDGNDKKIAGNWSHNQDVYSTYGSDSDLWGLALTPSDVNASNFGVAISAQYSGIYAQAQIDYIKITVAYQDTTLPEVTPVISPAPINGWNNSNVSLTWTVSDPESEIKSKSGCDKVDISSETTGSTFTCSATSDAGTTENSVVIKIDKTAPIITLGSYDALTPTNKNIVVTATTNEGTLNEDSHTFSNNGTFTFTATDIAGNTSSKVVTINNIDKTPPDVPQNIGWSSDNPITGSDYTHGTDFSHYQTCGGYINYSPMTNLWAPVSDAVSYDREVYSPEGNLVYAHSLTSNYVNGGGAVDGNTYSIRIRAHDIAGNVSGWSPLCSAKYDTTSPTAQFFFPTPSTSAVSFSVVYSEEVNGSDADNPSNYYLENWPGYSGTGNLSGHATISYNSTSHTATVTFTTPGWYISPEQKWGVQNIHDLAGNQINSSVSYAYSSPLISPLAPTIVSSTPNPTNSVNQPWTWTAASDPGGVFASGIKEYWYMISGSTIQSWTNAGNVLSINTSLSEGNNQLSVKAFDNAGNEGAIATGSLLVDFTKPAAPKITFPKTGDYFKTSPILNQWTPISDTSGIKEYRIEYIYDDGHTFSGGPYRSTISTSRNHSPNITEQGGVTIRVQAIDNAGNEGYWSEPVHYFYDATAPTGTISYSTILPTQGPVVATLTVNDKSPVSITDDGGLDTHSFSDNGSFTFHFVDAAGNTGEATATVSNIDKTPPLAPTLIAPVNNTYTNSTTLTNSWSTVDDAVKYIYESYTNASATSLRWHQEIAAPSTSKTAINVADTTFWWRVKAVDAAGNESSWSTLWKVTIDTKAPTLSNKTTFQGWYKTDQKSIFTFTDENGLVSEEEIACTISTEGENQTCTVTPNVCDQAGNCTTETFTSNGANIDKTNPVINLTIDPTNADGDNGWYKVKPKATLSVNETNPSILEYQWDSQEGEWTSYVSPFYPGSEGVHTLYYRAEDMAGNTANGSKEIKWDGTDINLAPQKVTANPNPTSGTTSLIKWETAKDNIGIDRYEIKWTLNDPSNPLSYSLTVGSDIREKEIDKLIEGRWTVSVRAFDSAGHSQDSAIDLIVDRTPPATPTLSLTGTGVGTATLSWTAVSDAKDYIVWYGNKPGERLFGARVGNTTSYTVKGLGAGNYYFIVKAVDEAQNQGAESNEVNTGTIIGAPGVAEGTPAEGFTPEVKGINTDATPSASVQTPSVLGDTTNNKNNYWWWLLLLLIPAYIGWRRMSKNK